MYVRVELVEQATTKRVDYSCLSTNDTTQSIDKQIMDNTRWLILKSKGYHAIPAWEWYRDNLGKICKWGICGSCVARQW